MFENEIADAQTMVMTKLQELQVASDMLAVWKTRQALAYNAAQCSASDKIVLPATAKATKTIRFKKTGYTVATAKRKKSFLIFVHTRISTPPSFEEIKILVKDAADSYATFRWCKGLSDVSILGLYNYCKDNF